jgi:uncharacterized protein (DUF433 family)
MNRTMDISKNPEDRIVRDPGICGGEAVFKGTRVTLRTVLACLGAGDTVAEILSDFPSLKSEDIQSAIAFNFALAKMRAGRQRELVSRELASRELT